MRLGRRGLALGLAGIGVVLVSLAGGADDESDCLDHLPPLPAATEQLPAVPADWHVRPLRRVDDVHESVASSGTAALAFDGQAGTAWIPAKNRPAWLTMRVAAKSPSRLLLTWAAIGFRYPYHRTAPKSYRVLVSTDSPDGVHGTWRLVVTVARNCVRTRADLFTAPGARWVRLAIDSSWAVAPSLGEVALYGLSTSGPPAAAPVIGDSITMTSLTGFAPIGGGPAVCLNAGTNGVTTTDGLAMLQLALATTPAGMPIGIALGTNDAMKGMPLTLFATQLQQMISAIRLQGRLPLVARPPWNPNFRLGAYVAVVDRLVKQNDIPPGPDLYGWFKRHRERLGPDRIHPDPLGERDIRRLWAQALESLIPVDKSTPVLRQSGASASHRIRSDVRPQQRPRGYRRD